MPFFVMKYVPGASRLICDVDSPTLLSRVRTCPGDVSLIAEKCLRNAPGERYRDAGELATDLRRHLAGESLLHARPSLLGSLRRVIVRHRRWAFPAVVGATLAASVLALAGREKPAAAGTSTHRDRAPQAR